MTLSDDTFQISTPENVDFGYEIAGIGSRFLAAVVDTLLITILQGAALLAVLFGAAMLDLSAGLDEQATLSWVLAIYFLVSFAFLWGYYIFFETLWDGQTPGKRWARLRVIRSDGLPIGFAEAAIRNLVRLVDFLPLYYGVGVVAMFIDGRWRRLGDLAAGTLVVRDRGTITLESLEKEQAALLGIAAPPSTMAATGAATSSGTGIADPGAAAPLSPMAATEQPVAGIGDPGAPPPSPMAATAAATQQTAAPDWPVKRLTADDLRLAEDFLRRRADLANRSALGRQVAQRLQNRMGLPPDEMQWVNPEEFLQQVLRMRREG